MSSNILKRAIDIATEVHEGQTRKGTDIPYITHPIEVQETVRRHGGSEIEQAAALCHDTVEDGGGLATLERLRRELGEEVAAIVAACSDSFATDATQKAPWQQRKDAYIAHLRDEASTSALLVSCADKLANAQATLRDLTDPAVGAAVWERFSTGEAGQHWYYGCLVEVFATRLPGPLSAEFAQTIADLRALSTRAN
ncbi:MAG: HD domain-containing protein [Myxococcota bacterium]